MPKPKAFVIMPFAEIHAWAFTDMIKPALEAEFQVLRADNYRHQHQIMRDVVVGIWQADVIVADLAGFNPNVMYELGIAHTLGVPTILLCQQKEGEGQRVRLPFDLGAYRVLFYFDTGDSRSETVDELRVMARERVAGTLLFSSPVADMIEEVRDKLVNQASLVLAPFAASLEHRYYQDDELRELSREYLETINSTGTDVQRWASTLEVSVKGNQVIPSITSYAERSHKPGFGGQEKRRLSKTIARAADEFRAGILDALSILLGAIVEMEESTDAFLSLPWIRSDADADWASVIIKLATDAQSQIRSEAENFGIASAYVIEALDITSETRSAGNRLAAAIDSTGVAGELMSDYYGRVADVLQVRLDEYRQNSG